ncbi:hypothetical protein SVAN01_07087 [Stagonosporopsis vannaccii]|nr:hypothetical protein SVAN01_07087 [Stagonosporopsis vannaccii]
MENARRQKRGPFRIESYRELCVVIRSLVPDSPSTHTGPYLHFIRLRFAACVSWPLRIRNSHRSAISCYQGCSSSSALTVWPVGVARSIPRLAGRAGAEAAPPRASNRRKDAGSHGPHRHGCVVMTRQATFCGPESWRPPLDVPWKRSP